MSRPTNPPANVKGNVTSPELPEQAIADKLSAFREKVIGHPAIESAMAEAEQCVSALSGPNIVLLVGPTGVGKTTLMKKLSPRLKAYFNKRNGQDDRVHVLYGNAVPSTRRTFNWKDLYIRILVAAGETLVDKKIDVPNSFSLFPEFQNPVSLHAQDEASLRRAVEQCLKRRGIRVLIIDEAQHLLLVKDDMKAHQFETLKSLAHESGATIVLAGTYDLLEIRDGSAQLVRRSKIVPFQRYDVDKNGHLRSFKSAAKTLLAALPIKVDADLNNHFPEIYRRCAGCVGILKDWLLRALEEGLRTGQPLTMEMLRRRAQSNREVKTLMTEIFAGEAKLVDITDDELEEYLTSEKERQFESDADKLPPYAKPPVSRNQPVGKRTLQRDRVGMSAFVS